MARGKYAAKAANRLARLDNELLAEKVAEVKALTDKIGELQACLTAERADRSAIVLARADELSRETVATVNRQAAEQITLHNDTLIKVAELLSGYFCGENKIPQFYLDQVLPLLIPDQRDRSHHINDVLLINSRGSREARRHGAANLRRSRLQRGNEVPMIEQAIALEKEHPEEFASGKVERIGARFRINDDEQKA